MTCFTRPTLNISVTKLAHYYKKYLDDGHNNLGDEYFYQSLPLCVIDAVWSIGVHYTNVKNVVKRYCAYFNVQRIRLPKKTLPKINTQQSTQELFKSMKQLGHTHYRDSIFKNRQRTSSCNGICKSEAVLFFCKELARYGVHYFQDVPKIIHDKNFEKQIKSIPGQKSGLSLKYFFMLSGSDNLIKPDRFILKCLKSISDRSYTHGEAQEILVKACAILKADFPKLTPRLLDNKIWSYQRKLKSPNKCV